MIKAFGIGAEFQHIAWRIGRTLELAAGGELGRIANIDDQDISLADHVAKLGRVEPRH